MNESLQRIRDVFWNPDERRLRAPLRVIIQFVLVLVSILIISSDAVKGGLPLESLHGPYQLAVAVLLPAIGYCFALLAGARFLDRRPIWNYGLNVDREWRREFGVGFGVGAFLITAGVLFQLGFGWAQFSGYGGFTSPGGILPFVIGFILLWVVTTVVFVIQYANAVYVIKNTAEGLAGYITPLRAVGIAVGLRLLMGVFLFSNSPNASSYAIFVELFLQLIVLIAYAYTGNVGFSAGFATGWTGFILLVFDGRAGGVTSPISLFNIEYTGPAAITGGEFGVDGGMIAMFATVFALFILFGWLRATGRLDIPERVYTRIDRRDKG